MDWRNSGDASSLPDSGRSFQFIVVTARVSITMSVYVWFMLLYNSKGSRQAGLRSGERSIQWRQTEPFLFPVKALGARSKYATYIVQWIFGNFRKFLVQLHQSWISEIILNMYIVSHGFRATKSGGTCYLEDTKALSSSSFCFNKLAKSLPLSWPQLTISSSFHA